MNLSDEQIAILKDLSAFIDWCIKHDRPFGWCLVNVGHDTRGLIDTEPCFLPRTSGYAATLAGES